MHIPLKSLIFLALDCQTTGNSPKYNHLLEIGWLDCNTTGSRKPDVQSPTTFVIRQPQHKSLSKRIQTLTGISVDLMKGAVAPHTALDALLKNADRIARLNRMSHCPVVIHYARFEMGFIRRLQETLQPESPIPFKVICTHQIVSKLIPQLPRKGIRAVAGYLGHSVPVAKRCAHHLVATNHIWRHLVDRLADQAGVETLDQLERWLKQDPVESTAKSYPMPREKRLEVPESPGIYRMLRSNGDVLYIGKATSLKKRINSYFQKRRHSEAMLEMLTQAVGLEVTKTGSALEAALRESDAIKVFDPPYNSALVGRHRQLHYVSRNFGLQSSQMNNGCPLGPVTSADPFAACHALGAWLDSLNRTSPDVHRMMAMPEAHSPDETTFRSGMALFTSKHGATLKRLDLGPAVLHIGRRSWMKRLASKATEEAQDTEPGPPDDQTDFEWTPETVVSSIESICRRCGFMLRRARWLALLSESTLVWRAGEKAAGGVSIMVMHNGDLAEHYRSGPGTPIPEPPGSTQPHAARRGRIDLMRYDRLRVLTTEMRRLLSENRLQCVRLSKKVYLSPEQLQQVFNWV